MLTANDCRRIRDNAVKCASSGALDWARHTWTEYVEPALLEAAEEGRSQAWVNWLCACTVEQKFALTLLAYTRGFDCRTIDSSVCFSFEGPKNG